MIGVIPVAPDFLFRVSIGGEIAAGVITVGNAAAGGVGDCVETIIHIRQAQGAAKGIGDSCQMITGIVESHLVVVDIDPLTYPALGVKINHRAEALFNPIESVFIRIYLGLKGILKSIRLVLKLSCLLT